MKSIPILFINITIIHMLWNAAPKLTTWNKSWYSHNLGPLCYSDNLLFSPLDVCGTNHEFCFSEKPNVLLYCYVILKCMVKIVHISIQFHIIAAYFKLLLLSRSCSVCIPVSMHLMSVPGWTFFWYSKCRLKHNKTVIRHVFFYSFTKPVLEHLHG